MENLDNIKLQTEKEIIEKYKYSSRHERRKLTREYRKLFNDKTFKIPYGKTFSKSKEPLTREQRRQLLKDKNLLNEIRKIILKYFPSLFNLFDSLTDTRHKSYIKYNMRSLIVTRIIALISAITSMHGINTTFNSKQAIKNLSSLCSQNLSDIPDWQTIQDVIEELNIHEIEDIRKYMIKALIRSKMFSKYRYKKFFLLVVDATGLNSFDYNLNNNCITRTRDGNIKYYKYVLGAKIVVGNIVLSLDSEWIENSNISNDNDKQDCEVNAFKRMAPRIHKNFPHMNFIISGDALYANDSMISLCEDFSWKYIFNFKQKRLKVLFSTFEGNIKLGNESSIDNYFLSTNLTYKDHTLHAFRYQQIQDDNSFKFFNYITNLHVSNTNLVALVSLGRRRWKIENEGFNVQKNGTFCISHLCSRNDNALKIHYLFIQIAHIIRQLLDFGSLVVRDIHFKTLKEVTSTIITNITSNITSEIDLNINFQLRFSDNWMIP